MPPLKMLVGAGRIATHVIRDRVTQPVSRELDDIPASRHSLTNEWLTAALCAGHPGAAVTQFYVGAPNEGTTSRRALVIDYNAVGTEAGLPTRVFAKFSSTLVSRMMIGLSGAGAAETGFYSHLRPMLDFEGPDGYYAAFDPRSCRCTLLIEDVVATRGVTWADATTTQLDRSLAERMVDTMAGYHGALWNHPVLDEHDSWLPSGEAFQLQLNGMLDFEHRCSIGVDRCAGVLPDALIARSRELFPALMRSLAAHKDQPRTLLHQDTHPFNWYIGTDGGMGLFDWNAAAVGSWALDFSYALAANLTVEDRRAWERELLERYLKQLRSFGCDDPPTFDQAWLEYRRQLFHGLFFWLFVAGAGRLQPKMYPRSDWEVVLRRLGQAIVDVGALEAVA